MVKSKTVAQQLGESGERMVPDVHKNTLMYAEHLTRYLAARELVKDKVVLDIASGSGYGSKILSETANEVFGVDVDEASVQYAKKNFGAKNIVFKQGDGESIPLEDDSVDVAITFETIEHIKDYEKFMQELSRVVKPEGIVIVSTPNDLEFAEGNHYHLHEFEENELNKLISKFFNYTKSYYQATWKYVAIGSKSEILEKGRAEYPVENYFETKPTECLYFYVVCSNRKITEEVSSMGVIAEHYSDRYLIGKDMINEKNIADYKNAVEHYKNEYGIAINEIDKLRDQLDHANKWIEKVKSSPVYKVVSKVTKQTS